MMAEEKKMGIRQIGQMLALLLFLIVLPAGSWYYLRTGLDYRIKHKQELQDLAEVPEFSLYRPEGDTLTRASLLGKITIVSFPNLKDPELRKFFGDNLGKLHEQFDDSPDLLFLQHTEGVDSIALSTFREEYSLDDPAQCLFVSAGTPSFESLARSYALPQDAAVVNPYLALVDTSLTVRRIFDVRKIEDIRNLVSHVALLLPREKEEDPILKREKEK